MRLSSRSLSRTAAWAGFCAASLATTWAEQKPLAAGTDVGTQAVSNAFFASLERQSRLADIAYCVGRGGITQPFSCASRCHEFPTVRLVSTFNTGVLTTDSCGYIAVDHGKKKADAEGDDSDDALSAPTIIIAFRGTHSITNTVLDLGTVPQEYVPYPDPDDDGDSSSSSSSSSPPEPHRRHHHHHHRCTNCTVHMGFLASWRSARKLIMPVLETLRAEHPTYPVHLVGHSLGGAVAALAALELATTQPRVDVRVTTFGEPRVGNQGLADFVDAVFGMETDDGYDGDLEARRYRRVTHIHDPVPLLPLTEWGYRPHAGEVFITKPDLSPAPEHLRLCRGDADARCIAGQEGEAEVAAVLAGIPSRLKLWELLFAHRDYFWRIGLCIPGGDPADWGRDKYNYSRIMEEL